MVKQVKTDKNIKNFVQKFVNLLKTKDVHIKQ